MEKREVLLSGGARFSDDGDVLLRARELWTGGDLQNALVAYRRALSLFPMEYQLYQEAGAVLFQLGMLDESARYYQAYLQLEGSDSRAWNDLGVLRFEQDNFEEAVVAFEKAIQLDRKNGEYLCNLANALMEKGDQRASVKLLREILQTHPTEGRAHCLLGIELEDPDMRWETGKVEVGQLITVMRHTYFSGSAGDQQWKSRVENVSGETIQIALPTAGWRTMPLREGTRLILGYVGPDAFWGVVAEVTGLVKENIPLVEVRHEPAFKRLQRRSDVRVSPGGSLKKITVVDPGSGEGESAFRGDLAYQEDNLSATGTGFLVQDAVALGAGVLMDLQMGEESFSLEGRVVRKIPQKDGRDLIGVAFINLDDKTHELLARHVHRLQLERRRNSIQ